MKSMVAVLKGLALGSAGIGISGGMVGWVLTLVC